MRYAIISDIHSNLQALQAVRASLDRDQLEEVICLGDIVGYGADPGPCLAEVKAVCRQMVAGNHDQAAVGKTDVAYFNASARKAAEWTAQKLASDEKKFISGLPLSLDAACSNPCFLAVHSTPEKPEEWHYILSIDEAEYQFERFKQSVCFIGHSHQPIFWQLSGDGQCSIVGREYLRLEEGKRYIINVGSVGQPRDGDPRACYAIFDTERMELVIRRVEYDIAAAQQRIIKASLPPRLAERLAMGV
jgi:diadenosine tetraphosphatase ApaH/serine/threonine PP2A family protein phosphatase